jgi:NADP-reducing hydrogenase subunit HndA
MEENESKVDYTKQTDLEETQMQKCCEGKDKYLEELFKKYLPIKDNLIQMLNEIQEHYGYVPMEVQKELSNFLNISMAEIYGVVTFYSRFSLKPKGKYSISVCLGTACFVKGSQKIMDRLKERLKIEEGETTSDGMFSIEAQRCVGACGLAPVFTVNGKVYGKATVKMLDEVLDELMK